jgi:hypothetical protein
MTSFEKNENLTFSVDHLKRETIANKDKISDRDKNKEAQTSSL